jgi:TP901 family phage tail tape measure protein
MSDSLIIRIGAKANEFDKELQRLKGKTKSFEKGLATTAKISAAAFAGLAAAVGVAVTKFSSFEKSFTNVQTLLDKSSFSTKTLSKGIKELRNDVLKLGADSGESFDVLNQALFDLISAGVPAEEATSALTDAVNLATAGATDTATSVKALTAAITAYGSEAGSTTDITEKFFTAQKFGVTTVGELATEFNKVGGLAKQLGISFDEALAASTALTANGAKPTAQAFTEFRAVLNSVILAQGRLKDESSEVRQALSLQNIEQKGIVGALDELRVATGGNVVTLQKLLGSSEALSAALSLTGAQAGVFGKILGELNDEQARAAAFNDALKTKQETLDKSLAKLSRSFEAIVITLGERFAPLIAKIAESLTDLAKRFSGLDDETKDSIATFIKWGAIVTAGVTAISAFGLAAIKISAVITSLVTVFGGGALAAGTFWAAVTGPIGIAVAGLAAIAAGVVFLVNKLSADEEPKTLTAINDELDKLKKKQDEIQNSVAPSEYARQEQLDGVAQEIAKLEELRKKQLEIANQESDGSILLRPQVSDDPIDDLTKGLLPGQQDIPLRATGGEEPDEGIKAQREKAEEEKKAAAEKAAQEELERQRVLNEKKAAQEAEAAQLAAEEKALRLENEKRIEDEFRALTDEEKKLFDAKEIEELNNQVLTKKQIEDKSRKDEIKSEIAQRNQYLKDEVAHGKVVATLNQFLNKSEVQGAVNTAGQLAQLQNSKNKTLKAIGKRAAQAQIAIDTARGAVAAYTSLAGIPFIGPGLGAAAAAALVAYGAERITQVNAAQRGGIVPNAVGGGSRDRVPMLLEPNELVVPKALAPDFIQSVGRPDAQGGESDADARGSIVEIGIEDDAADFITAKQRENTDLAIGVA